MSKYIDAEKLIADIERWRDKANEKYNESTYSMGRCDALAKFRNHIASLQQEQDMGEVSDGYHTFNELYYYRMLYNAAFFNLLPKNMVHKSKRHHTGEECFGGGWFIVMANLPTGQVSNHYELKDWNLFKVPEKEFADEWDGHTPQEAAERIHKYLQQGQPEVDLVAELEHHLATTPNEQLEKEWKELEPWNNIGPTVQEFLYGKQPEVDLNEEIDRFLKSEESTTYENAGSYKVAVKDLKKIARHFYELGLNARKEEKK